MGIDCALLALFVAHQGQFARTLMVEPAGEVLHVVVHASITGEARKRSLMMLEPKQREALLVQRALDGVRLKAGSATIAVENVELKTKLDGMRMELMIHGTARMRGSEMAVETTADADPIDLVVLPGDRPVVRASRGANSGTVRAKMGAGDRIQWVMLAGRAPPH